ncbi:MAG: N-acetylmuramoyl-L-alanine amidase-like domain-containing protein [Rickettsia endosymbiont of Pentastiridius leporinus]
MIKNLHKLAISLKDESFVNKVLAYSQYFIGEPYNTELGTNLIIWDQNRDKNELINIESFDCFSYIEMVIALSEIKEPAGELVKFKEQLADSLAKIMFLSSPISYVNRNHFMDEWLENNSKCFTMKNILENLPYAKVKTAMINKAGLLETQIADYASNNLPEAERSKFVKNYTYLIKSIKPFKSDISYISFADFLKHAEELTKQLKDKLYIIVITIDNPKLLELTESEHNIAHVGFVFTKNDKLYLRHATQVDPKEVVEVSLEEYANSKKESKIFTGFTLFSVEQKHGHPG